MAECRTKAFRHSSTYYRRVIKRLTSQRSKGNKGFSLSPIFVNDSLPAVTRSLYKYLHATVSPIQGIASAPLHNHEQKEIRVPNSNTLNENNENECESLEEDLKKWAIKFNIPHSALGELLKIFNNHGLAHFSNSRSFLKTPRAVEISLMGEGQYWHNGSLQISIGRFLSNIDIPDEFELRLSFNIDGLPISKSSKQQFWPILCKINNFENHKPIVVGIYYGLCKPPSAQEYLSKFVSELKDMMQNGIHTQRWIFKVASIFFICDTPARSFVKGVVNFNHYSGCTKCSVLGEYSHKERRMTFPRFDCPRRTNTSFRNRLDPIHHKEYSPLEELPIDLIRDFPVSDSLHLLHLGIMKKCLLGWINGSLGFDTKWSATDIRHVSNLLNESSKRMPVEIHRAVRSLEHIRFWKATEFRTFLLYLGPVLLKDVLQREVYQHFLLIFCAVTICSSNKYQKFLNIAEELMEEYLEKYIEIYGMDSITSNVHNLCHMIDDVKMFGPLPSFSCYPFENALHEIKMLLRSGNKPLSQAAKRLTEISDCKFVKQNYSKFYPITNTKACVNLKSNAKYLSNIQLSSGYVLKTDKRNNFVLLENNIIIEILSIINLDNEVCIYGKPVLDQTDFFQIPFKSSRINIYCSFGKKGTAEYNKVQDIKCKMISLVYKTQQVFIPLIHTI